MKNKNLIFLIVGAVAIGLLIGVLSSKLQTPRKPVEPRATTEDNDQEVEDAPKVIPTFPPLAEKIKRIESDKIIVEGERGEMSIPKNPDFVKVYRRINGDLVVATFEDIRVGQNATLKIIVPKKAAELIIE